MGESDEADWPEDDTELFGDETPEPKSEEEELANDLLSIVTVFTAKYHGRRSYVNKKN